MIAPLERIPAYLPYCSGIGIDLFPSTVDEVDNSLASRAAELEGTIAAHTRCEVNIFILTPDRVRYLREHDRPFYTALITGHLTLAGVDFATT